MGAGRAGDFGGGGCGRCWVTASLLAVVACTSGEGGAAKPIALRAPAMRTEDYAFAGCAVLRTGPRCELSETRELTFWVPTANAMQAASDAGAVRFGSTEAVSGGTRYRLRVPKGARFVELREQGSAGGFRLPVGDAQPAPALAEATALRAQGKFVEARARVEAALPALPPEQQGRARALLARIALSQDDYATAVAGLRESMNTALSTGRVSDAVYDATALAYVSISNLQDYAAAREVLDRAALAAAVDPASRALLPHYRGLLALETGDLRHALAWFREAAKLTGRLGMDDHERLAHQNEANTLALLGRHGEAIASQRQLLRRLQSREPCRVADAQEQLVWLVILAEPARGDALLAVGRGASSAASSSLATCASPWRHRNHLIDAGILALQQDDLAAATVALADLEQVRGGEAVRLVTWESELRGRIALATQRPKDALPAFERALSLASRAGLWENEYLAQLGLGRALEALRKTPAAISAYAAADALLDRLLGSVPLGEGQAGFLREREAGTQRLVALLVDVGKPAEALDVARRARARVIASVAHPARLERLDGEALVRWEAAIARYRGQRAALEREQAEAWKLPADQLAKSQAAWVEERRAALSALDEANALLQGASLAQAHALARPQPGEALLAYFPIGDGVVGFVARADTTRARHLPALALDAPRSALGAAWLEPFRDDLKGVERIRIITHAALARVDVHALELDGAPLLARVPVLYALDAPARAESAGAHRGAALMIDPTGDLPAAKREGEIAAQALGAATTTLFARDAATRAHALGQLAQVALFHYAGHGQFSGTEGIDSGLQLADGQLSLGDILALHAAPRLVVLSACEGARAEGPGFAGGLSVAEAFIAAGVREVVASTRPVADDATRALFTAFYAALTGDSQASAASALDSQTNAASALRQAQLQMREKQPDSDWASFRVLVP